MIFNHNLKLLIKCENTLNIPNLQYETIDSNNKEHVEVLKIYLFSPMVTRKNNVYNQGFKTVYDFINHYKNTNVEYQVMYFIDEKGIKKYIGIFRIFPHDFDKNSVFIAYVIIPKYQGRKLGRQIPKLIEQYISKVSPTVVYIYAHVWSNNIPSIKVLESNGFIRAVNNNIKINKPSIQNDTINRLYNNIDCNQNDTIYIFQKKRNI